MNTFQKIAVGAAVLLVGGIAMLFSLQRSHEPVPESVTAPPTTVPESPLVRFPMPDAKVAEEMPLPSLEQSDEAVLGAFESLLDKAKYGALFNLNKMIDRIVVTVDNLPQRNIPWAQSILLPTKGDFQVKKVGITGNYLDAKNYKRYALFVEMVDAVDVKKMVAVYVRFYSLFQESYLNLGYTKKYFNDRVISTIDLLLATPDVQGEIALKQPSVYYVFADAKLEALSSGQKVLIRMGSENAAKVKNKLRDLRQELVDQTKPLSK